MPLTNTFANGQTFTSSALAQTDLNAIMQTLTLNVLNINPATDALAYSKVRIAWIAQPGFTFTDDVCSIQATETNDEYTANRDRKFTQNDATTILQTDTYMRCWQVAWVFYGPNGFDHARLLKSAMTLDWAVSQLAASQLSLLTKKPATVRAPEKRDGQWWERNDVRLRFYEFITETLVVNSIASAEILLFTERGQVADLEA